MINTPTGESCVQGLTREEADRRLKKHGPNEVRRTDRWKVFRIALEQFRDPLVLLLLAAAGASQLIGETLDAALIAAIVVINGAIGFFQEWKAERTIEGIQERVRSVSRVIRDGKVLELDSRFLVPGDLIVLEAGDKVPADCSIASGELSLDESMLTGESLPVFRPEGELHAGTLVVKGKAKAEVTATGMATRIGQISKLSEVETATPFQQKLRVLSSKLGKTVVLVAALVAAAGVLQGRGLLDMAQLGISLGVAAVPEGLIILSTMCLAVGVRRMADQRAIVKRLPAVEALGSVDVLCVDKTGTITENRLRVKESWGDPKPLKEAAALTSRELKDPMDAALREWAGEREPDGFEPFDSDRRFARATSGDRQFVKGAPEVVAGLCAKVPEDFDQHVHKMAAAGLKVIALASGRKKLKLHGLVGLYDPPRAGVKEVIATAGEMGVDVVMVTGDHPDTALAIARQVGIDGKVVELDGGFGGSLEGVGVFARVAPEDKLRIVDALQERGLKVGMTGDGVNDVPALKKADIGIALGSGTEIAREAADIVLLDDDLSTIVGAVKEGRSVFTNVRKAAQYLLSMNAAELLAISLGMFFGAVMFEPAQILWMNLVTDSLPALAFAYDSNPPGGKNRNIVDGRLWQAITAAGTVLGLGAVTSFLGWGHAAALNTLIYSEIFYQPLVRRKYHSSGFGLALAFLAATVTIQLAATWFLGAHLGLGFPGAELLVVGASLALLAPA
jgi:Ca2+-transporting ATPase